MSVARGDVSRRAILGVGPARAESIISARAALPGILAIALALRVGHVLALRSTLWFENLDLDPAYFDEWGRRIAAGDWVGSRMFFVDPLYPYFLGVVYTVFGHDLLVVRLIQALLGVGTVWLVADIGRRLGGRATGNVAALLYAVYPPAIFNEAEIEKTALAAFFLALAVAMTLRRSRNACIVAGVAIGLASLSRANMLLLVVPLGVYLVREAGVWHWRRLCLFLAASALVLTPVVWRNHHVGGEYALVTSAGQNLFIGNNPYNTGGSYGQLPFVRANPAFEENDFRTAAEAQTGRAMGPGEVSRFWAGQALEHARLNPGFALRMLGRKAELLVNDYEVPDNQDMYFVKPFSPVLRWSFLSFGWILPFALVGLATSFRSRGVRLLAAVLAVYTCTVVAFFVNARYRIPMMPLLVVLAALGLGWIVRSAAALAVRKLVVAALAVTAVALLSFHHLSFHDRTKNTALAWHNLAGLQASVGHYDDAVGSYATSLKTSPELEESRLQLAVLLASLGRLGEAEEQLVTATRLNPLLVDAWVDLGDVYRMTDRPERAGHAYEKALSLSPGAVEIERRLEVLKEMP